MKYEGKDGGRLAPAAAAVAAATAAASDSPSPAVADACAGEDSYHGGGCALGTETPFATAEEEPGEEEDKSSLAADEDISPAVAVASSPLAASPAVCGAATFVGSPPTSPSITTTIEMQVKRLPSFANRR